MSARIYEVPPPRKRRAVERALIDAAVSQADTSTRRGPGRMVGYVVVSVYDNGAVNRDLWSPPQGSKVGGALFRALVKEGVDMVLTSHQAKDAAHDVIDERYLGDD